VITVWERAEAVPAWVPVPAGQLRLAEDAEREARAALERVVAELPNAEAAFLHGDPAEELARESQFADCLVIGSRDYGPAPAVLLGGVGEQVARTAECPLIVVPHGVREPLSPTALTYA
jgi:nucleotide-binding universal stress UspA family protein